MHTFLKYWIQATQASNPTEVHLCIQIVADSSTFYLPLRNNLGADVRKFGRIGHSVPTQNRPQAGIDYRYALASVDKGIHNKTTKYGLPTYWIYRPNKTKGRFFHGAAKGGIPTTGLDEKGQALYIFLHNPALKIRKIYGVAAVFVNQWAFHNVSAIKLVSFRDEQTE